MQIFTNVRRIALFVFSMVLSTGILIAQERTITGTVSAEGEGTLPGVNVTVQGTTVGTITDANGTYSVKVPGPTAVLVFSSIGYVTQGITVGTQTVIDVVLVSDVKALQEVVVTGYSSQRKRDITGAVSVVETSKLTAIPVGNVTNQLQGATSGVTVTGNGMPGTTASVRIRGFSSFENNSPLYVVDGVPVDNISYLNPNDLASVTVLKDAGAASVYGSRASNGVIVITTKKGSKGVKVTYDMYYGTQNPGSGPTSTLLNTQEYANLQWLVYDNDGTSETHPVYGPSSNPTPTLPDWAANTDWYDAITDPAPIQNHDLTFSGGSDNAKFFGGIGYFNQQGIVIHTWSKRYSVRFNSEFTFLNDRVKIGENANFTMRQSLQTGNLGEGSPINSASYRSQPIIPVIWTGDDYQGTNHLYTAGDYGGTGIAPRLGNGGNTYASLTRDKDDRGWGQDLLGSLYLDIKIMKGLNFKSTLGGSWGSWYGSDYTFATYENAENTATPYLSEYAGYWGQWTWTNQLTFDRVFGQHKIQAVAGYEAIKTGMGRDMSGSRSGYYSDDVDFRTLTNGAQARTLGSSLYTPVALVSIFGKADYAFMDKYILSATVRRDGSSKFGEENRYGVFPAFSAAWRIGEEAFLDGLDWISDLKIRGSYGTMGNQLALSAQNQFYLYGGDPASSNYDLGGTGTSSLQGFRPTRIRNPYAKWETNVTADIGFEAQLFNSKLGIVFDWYAKNTKDLLFAPELPGTAGAATAPYVNVASMENHGIDLEVSYKNTWGDLGFNISGVFTTYKNKITKIADGYTFFDYGGATTRIGAANRNAVGHPISSFYGYQVVGLFQSSADTAASPIQDGMEPGFLKYANLDQTSTSAAQGGRQVIDPLDRTFMGDPNPDFTYGLNLGLSYKGIDMAAFVYGSYGNDIFNWNKWWIDFWPSFQGQKSKDLLYNSWTPDNTNTSIPKASNKSNFSTNTVPSSYYIEDGSYARLKTLQLGYTIPQKVLSKVNVKSLRVYVQAVNLFTITKYSGMDPELGGDDRAFGADTGNYPNVKQFIFGINLVL